MMPAQTNGKITAAHINYKVSRRLIFKWHNVSEKAEKESLEDDFCSGRPVKVR